MDNLLLWSNQMKGAREMLKTIIKSVNESKGRFLLDKPGKDSKVYHQAIVDLILSDLDSTERFLLQHKIAYRNHVRDKKGKLIKVEAYFV